MLRPNLFRSPGTGMNWPSSATSAADWISGVNAHPLGKARLVGRCVTAPPGLQSGWKGTLTVQFEGEGGSVIVGRLDFLLRVGGCFLDSGPVAIHRLPREPEPGGNGLLGESRGFKVKNLLLDRRQLGP